MTGLTLSPSQLVQAVPDRYSHLWQRIGDVLRLIQPGAPQGSNMQRDMQWDVTCCTVTSASLLAILCLQHCDAFSTRKEHHDQSTDSRSGGRPPDHSEKRCAPHHRLSAASSE